jgi:hypothetical protein
LEGQRVDQKEGRKVDQKEGLRVDQKEGRKVDQKEGLTEARLVELKEVTRARVEGLLPFQQ